MENEIRITLRLPGDLHSAILATSSRYGTSLNGQIVTMLRDWYSNESRFAEMDARLKALESKMLPH